MENGRGSGTGEIPFRRLKDDLARWERQKLLQAIGGGDFSLDRDLAEANGLVSHG